MTTTPPILPSSVSRCSIDVGQGIGPEGEHYGDADHGDSDQSRHCAGAHEKKRAANGCAPQSRAKAEDFESRPREREAHNNKRARINPPSERLVSTFADYRSENPQQQVDVSGGREHAATANRCSRIAQRRRLRLAAPNDRLLRLLGEEDSSCGASSGDDRRS